MSFRFTIDGRSPLLIQLDTILPGEDHIVAITEANAATETDVVAALTAPLLYRPSVPGTGGSEVVSNGYSQSTANCIVRYTTLPSTPDPTLLTTIPLALARRRYLFPEGSEMMILPQGAVVFYAQAAAGNSWSADLTWEEL